MKIIDYFYSLVPWVYAAGSGEADYMIKNPLKAENIQELIEGILRLVYTVGSPVVVLMFVYAGFLYVTARGADSQIKKAHTAFTYTIIGAAVVLGATVIATVIKGTISNISGQ